MIWTLLRRVATRCGPAREAAAPAALLCAASPIFLTPLSIALLHQCRDQTHPPRSPPDCQRSAHASPFAVGIDPEGARS